MVVGMPLIANNSPNAAPSRKISHATLQQYSPLLEERKGSIQVALLKAKEGLANPFACDELSAEELIYNLFKIPNKSEASIGKLLMVLKNYGLLETDPRLQPMMHKIREIEQEKEDRVHESKDPRHWKMNKEDFKKCIGESLSLIAQTLQNDLIVPSWGQFTQIIKEIYLHCKAITVGKVADYIPQLARFSPDQFGVSICTVDGQRISFGDAKTPFCMQSVSKAFNYAIAASEMGAEYVHKHVGQEPSGRLFNEICLDSNHKPHNPMVNSGAIIVTSLIQHKANMADRFDYVLTQYRKISGGEYVGFNNAVFLSERSTADRNFALAYYMKENNCFPENTSSLTEALDFYFQLCSLEVTCESASVMAATLANGGVCPITGERCIGSRPCRDVLSLMNSCGMYDYSGQFAFHVGLPGLLIVVVPNVLGLALWSPPLDKLGNSCRGVAFCKELVSRFNFHNYDSLAHNESRKFDPRRRVGDREKDQVVSLLFAAKAGDLNTVRRMYMQGFDLEMADYDKRTALHLAASEGHYDVASFLINTAKVKVDPKDRWDRVPLQDAKSQDHHSVVNLLEKATVNQLSVVESHEEESAASEFFNEVVQKPVLFSQHSVPTSLYSRPYTLINHGSTAAKRAMAIKKSMSVASALSYASSIPSSSSDEEGIVVKSLSPKVNHIAPVKEDEGDKTLSDDSAYNSPAVRQFSSTSSNPMISPVTATAQSPLVSPVGHARNGSGSYVGRQRVVPNDSHRQLNGLRSGVNRENMHLNSVNKKQINGDRARLEMENGLNELDDVENDSDVASITKTNILIMQKE